MDIGFVVLDGVGDDAGLGARGEVLPRRVIAVHHGCTTHALRLLGPRLVEHLEEAPLRGAIVLHSLVVVEVVAAQVREHRDIERARVHAVQIQPDRGALDHGVGTARLDHLGEHPLHKRRLLRGQPRRIRDHAASDTRLDRRQQPGGDPAGLERRED